MRSTKQKLATSLSKLAGAVIAVLSIHLVSTVAIQLQRPNLHQIASQTTTSSLPNQYFGSYRI